MAAFLRHSTTIYVSPFLHRLFIAYACQGSRSAHAVCVALRAPQPLFVTVYAPHTFFVRWPGAFQIASSTCDVATSLDEQFDNFPLGHRRKTEHRQTNVQTQKKGATQSNSFLLLRGCAPSPQHFGGSPRTPDWCLRWGAPPLPQRCPRRRRP